MTADNYDLWKTNILAFVMLSTKWEREAMLAIELDSLRL